MKVSELFAEIGFNVKMEGLDAFNKSMKGIQDTIKGCVSGLKEFAKTANQVSAAVAKLQNSYIPNQEEAKKRYDAITASIRAASYAKRAHGYYERHGGNVLAIGQGVLARGKGLLFAENARFREDQEERLWESKETQKEKSETQRLNYELNKEKFEWKKEHASDNGKSLSFGVAVGTIIGNIVSKAILGLFSHIKGWVMSFYSFIRDTVRAAMSYRDYRTFTGRSVNELSGLMGMTAYTTSMKPQDILKDAQGFQKQYWDMWFGKASPEAWQRLGIIPTGNGAQDLRNALMAIYNMTDKGRNSGAALSLLGSMGLDEQYLNIFSAMREGKSNTFEIMESQITEMERANEELNKFSNALEQVNMTIISVLLESGLNELIKTFTDTIRGMAAIASTDEFKKGSLMEKFAMLAGAPPMSVGEAKATMERGEIMTKNLSFLEKANIGLSEMLGWVAYHATGGGIGYKLGGGGSYSDFMKVSGWGAPLREYEKRVDIINNFDLSNRPVSEIGETYKTIYDKQISDALGKKQTQLNTTGSYINSI